MKQAPCTERLIMMEREETLENCLIVLGKRHPESHVDVNNAVLRSHQVLLHECTLSELRGQIQARAPQLLQQTAHVLEGEHTGDIFLLRLSEGEHIFRYHI